MIMRGTTPNIPLTVADMSDNQVNIILPLKEEQNLYLVICFSHQVEILVIQTGTQNSGTMLDYVLEAFLDHLLKDDQHKEN